MNKVIQTIGDIFSIKELRVRLLYTVFFLLLFRLGSYITLPGIDITGISQNVRGILGLLDSFLGGTFSKASVFALGVAPYISSSIIMQLCSIAWPKIQKIQRDGEMGRRRIAQITRVLTIFIAIFQAFQYLLVTSSKGNLAVDRKLFIALSIVILVAGSIFCMWLGEKITHKGIGNGVTMLIMIGIVSTFPGTLYQEALHRGSKEILWFILEVFVLFWIVILVIAFTESTRKIPIVYARQLGGDMIYGGGQRQYIPLKLNSSGVMPIIFAQLLIVGFSFFIGIWADKFEFLAYISRSLQDVTSYLFNILFFMLIVLFTYFYTAITVNPVKMADDMKRSNSFIPGVSSGYATTRFFDDLLDKITLPAALFLAIIAILPFFACMFGVSPPFSRFYGGTSLLIMVSAILEIIQQVSSYLLMRRYEVIVNTRYKN